MNAREFASWIDNAVSLYEVAATAASVRYGGSWRQGLAEEHKDPNLRYAPDGDMVHLSARDPNIAYQCLSDEIAALTVMHDPESVLRRCAADRRLMADILSERHVVVEDCWYTCPAATQENGGGEDCNESSGEECDCGRDERVRRRLQIIAEGYGWKRDASH